MIFVRASYVRGTVHNRGGFKHARICRVRGWSHENRVPGVPAHAAGDGSHRTWLLPGHLAVTTPRPSRRLIERAGPHDWTLPVCGHGGKVPHGSSFRGRETKGLRCGPADPALTYIRSDGHSGDTGEDGGQLPMVWQRMVSPSSPSSETLDLLRSPTCTAARAARDSPDARPRGPRSEPRHRSRSAPPHAHADRGRIKA